ncbi:hypothetical protein PUR23_23710 [Methylorubrum populi]|uniref:hypothetical protein n=1 Tax=Methylorubrum populi TaxID=223967 RepID=UPI0031F79645
MRVLRLVILAFGMLGGLAGLNAPLNAAPIPIAPVAGSSADAPLLAQVHWYGRRYYRRAYWGPRHYYRRPYWRARYDHRPHFYRPWY